MTTRTYRVEIAAYPHRGPVPYVKVWHVRADSVEEAQERAFRAMRENAATWMYARSTGVLRKPRVWLRKESTDLILTATTKDRSYARH